MKKKTKEKQEKRTYKCMQLKEKRKKNHFKFPQFDT